jgi:hypothetical protein
MIDPEVLDDLVESRRMIKGTIEKLKSDLDDIDNRIRTMGRGVFLTSNGSRVIVRPANRQFNVERAAITVPESVRNKAVRIEWDVPTLKAHMTAEAIESCMEPGTGKDRVSVE